MPAGRGGTEGRRAWAASGQGRTRVVAPGQGRRVRAGPGPHQGGVGRGVPGLGRAEAGPRWRGGAEEGEPGRATMHYGMQPLAAWEWKWANLTLLGIISGFSLHIHFLT